MANYMLFVIYSLALFGFAQCMRHRGKPDDDDDDDDGESSGLTVGQYAAIGIGGAVVFALIVMSIIALCIKCNKKSKAVQPTQGKHDGVATLTPRDGVSNKMALYENPPPYSLREQSPSSDVYLPPYSETKLTKHAV